MVVLSFWVDGNITRVIHPAFLLSCWVCLFFDLCCSVSRSVLMQWFGLIFIFCNLTLVIVTFSCHYYCCYSEAFLSPVYFLFLFIFFRTFFRLLLLLVLFLCRSVRIFVVLLIRPAWIVRDYILYIGGGWQQANIKKKCPYQQTSIAKTKPLLNWLVEVRAWSARPKTCTDWAE